MAQGDLPGARLLLEESLLLFHGCANRRGAALVLANLALVTLDGGDPIKACALYRESLALFEETKDTQNVALALNNLGHAAIQAGDYLAARQHLLASLSMARTLGSPFMELYVVVNLACLMAQEQRWRPAALLCGVADSRLDEHRVRLLPSANIYYREQREAIQNVLSQEDFLLFCQQGHNMRTDQLEALVSQAHTSVLA
jgi:tetratricopeptide (TPR) repeat protein